MCGIAGIFGAPEPETLDRMLRVIRHRGPDDLLGVSGERFSLGAVRLSIVDVDGGRQPIANETGSVWAAQNGELYNFPELRPQLLESGHGLHTRCDTEMLPHLYEEYGDRVPELVHGMFAIAIWDDRERRGMLARDRTGKKPLYYLQRNGKLYFGSEIKCLLRVPGFERSIDFEALHHYLSLKNTPCPLTIFEGIRMLPPGCRLLYRPGAEARVERYWQPDFSVDPELAELPEEELVDRLLALLRRGVERRLMADVPVGFYLSGGMDSSLTTALATEVASERVKTFTLTYGPASTTEGKQLDQRWARWVADRFDTEHHEEQLEFSDFPDNLRRILTHFDEPFAGVVSTYFLSQLIAKHVKVAVSGDGADELFGSYFTHRLAAPMAAYRDALQTRDHSRLGHFADDLATLERIARGGVGSWRSRVGVMSEADKESLYTPEVAAGLAGCSTERYWQEQLARVGGADPLNRLLEVEFRTIFADQVLAFVDRLSMAHSLEVRTAFLDTDVVEFVGRLPGSAKIRGRSTKHLLRQAARRYFPDQMLDRPKEGFLMPITGWILGDLEGYVRDTLSRKRVEATGVFAPDAVTHLVDALYAEQHADHFMVNKIYALLVFHEWYDLYM